MSKVLLCMILVQAISTGLSLLSRFIIVRGTFVFALLTYRYIVATICLIPVVVFFEGFGQILPLISTWKVWALLFVNALTGKALLCSSGENMLINRALFLIILAFYGLRDTSSPYSTTFLGMIPMFTFLTSIICRVEQPMLQIWAGRAKFVGVILCVGGALVASLYKGKEFYISHHSHDSQTDVVVQKTNMLRGTILLLSCCFSAAEWFVLQGKLLQVFPKKYWGIMLQSGMAVIQSAIVSLIIDHSEAAWRFGWNLQLITIVYSGALASAAALCLVSWAIKVKGPTYPTMFNPISLISVSKGSFFIGEPLGVGTLLGMVLIIIGLYFFCWGKKNEPQSQTQQDAAAASVPEIEKANRN
ncbi:WAT1-related protein [Spatholobus suberectus]|nr:WAT1-related protein [Spatholobus suberectus]